MSVFIAPTFSSQCDPKPEIQRVLLFPSRPLQPVQVLLQLVLPLDLSVAVRATIKGRLPLYLHRASGLCTDDHSGEGGCG